MRYDDVDFSRYVTEQLATLPGVVAVSLGGSRVLGTEQPSSDWDFAIYYRSGFDPESLRELGWAGTVSELGEWGGGVFNGGAWLEVDERRVDVHYRDLNDVEHQLAEVREGRFVVEHLAFYLAGVPSYVVVAELAQNLVLHGDLPDPEFPDTLRRTARERWWNQAKMTLAYARANHAERGQAAEVAGSLARAGLEAAHAVLAGRGHWVTNEKRLLERAGLRGLDTVLDSLGTSPRELREATDSARDTLRYVYEAE